jgi:hypothetical protein
MEDKVTNTIVTKKEMTIILKDGTKMSVPSKVIETFYESGRKDCNIEIEKPFNLEVYTNN